jgi:hypothetical protein
MVGHQEDDVLPLGSARVPLWWMETTPHNILDLEEGEHWRRPSEGEVIFGTVSPRTAKRRGTWILSNLSNPAYSANNKDKEKAKPLKDEEETADTADMSSQQDESITTWATTQTDNDPSIDPAIVTLSTFILSTKDDDTGEVAACLDADQECARDPPPSLLGEPNESTSTTTTRDSTTTNCTTFATVTTSHEEQVQVVVTVPKKAIAFSTLERREYAICPGDNPAGVMGVPLSMDWEYFESVMLSIDDYEAYRPTPRTTAEMRIPFKTRWDMLKTAGYSHAEILTSFRKANLARGRRKRTNETLALARIEEAVERAIRGILNATIRRSTKQKEREFLQRWTTELPPPTTLPPPQERETKALDTTQVTVVETV